MLNTLTAVALQCFLVYSPGTNGNWQEKAIHEFAHLEGWDHPAKHSAGGKAYQPPQKYVRLYHRWMAGEYQPRRSVSVHHVTAAQAMDTCDGHYGCQWCK
jgi:Ni/Co efflux regulator RcnB